MRTMYKITEKQSPCQTVLCIRRRGPYRLIAGMIPELCCYAEDKGLDIIGPPMFICHEMTPEEAMKADENECADVEVVIPISGPTEENEEITCYEIPSETMACVIHRGPYDSVTPAYEALFAWIADNGKEITGPIREIYLNDPEEVQPEEILTQICIPVR